MAIYPHDFAPQHEPPEQHVDLLTDLECKIKNHFRDGTTTKLGIPVRPYVYEAATMQGPLDLTEQEQRTVLATLSSYGWEVVVIRRTGTVSLEIGLPVEYEVAVLPDSVAVYPKTKVVPSGWEPFGTNAAGTMIRRVRIR